MLTQNISVDNMLTDYEVSQPAKKQLKRLKFFWLGFIIYSVGYTFALIINIKFCQAVQMLGLAIMTVYAINLLKFKISNQYLKLIYSLYCTWLLIVMLKDYNLLLDYAYIKDFIFSPYEGMLYFAPLILLLPGDFVSLKKLFDVIVICGICYLISDFLFIKVLMSTDRSNRTGMGIVEYFSNLGYPCGFLLLTLSYHSKKRQIFAVGVIIIAILLAVMKARRGLILMYSGMAFCSYLLYIYYSTKKLSILYLTLFIALLGALYISTVYKPRENRIYGFVVDRGSEDTRSIVELFFFDDMKPKDWIIGRGIQGKYFCPKCDELQTTNYRYLIETGYLQTILKGGILSLGLFLLIAVPAIIKGIFHSRNMLSKAAGIWILLCVVYSYPGNFTAFTLQYLLVWVSIGICYSKEIRYMTEDAIKNILHT